jgi:hypothetical protein
MTLFNRKHAVAEVKTPYATLQIVGKAQQPLPSGEENFFTKLVHVVSGTQCLYQFKVVDINLGKVQIANPTAVKDCLEQALTELVCLPEARVRFGLLRLNELKQRGTIRSRLYTMVNRHITS